LLALPQEPPRLLIAATNPSHTASTSCGPATSSLMSMPAWYCLPRTSPNVPDNKTDPAIGDCHWTGWACAIPMDNIHPKNKYPIFSIILPIPFHVLPSRTNNPSHQIQLQPTSVRTFVVTGHLN